MKKIFMAVLAISIIALPSFAEARKARKSFNKRPVAAAPAKTTQPKTAAPAQQAAAPAPAAAANTNTPAQAQTRQGGSMMGNIASTAAGVAIGSVIADSLMGDATAAEAEVIEDPNAIEPAAQ